MGPCGPPIRISPAGLRPCSSPHGPHHIPVSLAAPGHWVPPRAFWGGSGPGVPAASRLAAFGCWKQKKQIKTPQKGRKTKKREAKQRGGRPPGRPPPTAIAYSGVLAQRMHRYYQLEDVSEGENRLKKKKNREKKGLFRPRRSHAGGEGGAAAPGPPGPPGAPGMQRLPRTDIGSSNT